MLFLFVGIHFSRAETCSTPNGTQASNCVRNFKKSDKRM